MTYSAEPASLASFLVSAGYTHPISNTSLEKILAWIFTLDTTVQPFITWLCARLQPGVPFLNEHDYCEHWNGLAVLSQDEAEFYQKLKESGWTEVCQPKAYFGSEL